MDDDAVQSTPVLPVASRPELLIRFFPEYCSPHPLWFDFGFPDLADLRLPPDLEARLRRWSTYWDSTFEWDHGWPAGAPAAWWTAEEDRLPRDLAIAFGSEFVIRAGARYLRSRTGAGSPVAAAAVHALVNAELQERARIRADIAAGVRYHLAADDPGGTPLPATRDGDDPPGT